MQVPMANEDRYFKLYPPPRTPANELCTCPGTPPLKLMFALSYNPIHCMDCNLEVPPERLDLKSDLVEAVANWRQIHDALDHLWLDSGEYENWAWQQLLDISSSTNRRGRAVQQVLSATIRRCYYWYPQDQSADDYTPITHCPACGQLMDDYTQGIFLQRVCETCSIVAAGE